MRVGWRAGTICTAATTRAPRLRAAWCTTSTDDSANCTSATTTLRRLGSASWFLLFVAQRWRWRLSDGTVRFGDSAVAGGAIVAAVWRYYSASYIAIYRSWRRRWIQVFIPRAWSDTLQRYRSGSKSENKMILDYKICNEIFYIGAITS